MNDPSAHNQTNPRSKKVREFYLISLHIKQQEAESCLLLRRGKSISGRSIELPTVITSEILKKRTTLAVGQSETTEGELAVKSTQMKKK